MNITKNKKGVSAGAIIGIAIGVLILVALITSALVPFLAGSSVPILQCLDQTNFPVLNETSSLCFNQTAESNGISEAASNVGLSSTDISLMGLLPTFLIIGAIIAVIGVIGFMIVKKN